MARDGDKRRKKQDKRDKKGAKKGKPQGARSAEAEAAQFEKHLDRFGELCVEHEALEAFGFPMERLVPLLVDPTVTPPDADTELADVLIGRLADGDVARELQTLLARSGDELLEDLGANEDRKAVVAARSLVDTCVEEGAPPDHPLWDLILACSITRAFGAGHVLAHLADRAFARRAPTHEALVARLARGLDDPGLVAALARAQVARPDPVRLVTVLEDLVLPDEDLRPAFPIDGVLNLLRVQHHLLRRVSEQVLVLGPSQPMLTEVEGLIDEAFARDVDAELVRSLQDELTEVLVAHRGEPVEETEPLVAMLAALAAGSPADDPFLRRVHAHTIFAPAIEDEEEEALAIDVWGDAEDDQALAALEAGLAADPTRAGRVARYRKTLVAELDRFVVEGEGDDA